MTSVLIDTSVLIKWFHAAGESELVESRLIRDAHVRGDVNAHVLDLAFYEVGNVLVRSLRWDAADVARQLDDLLTIVGTPLAMSSPMRADAADLAQEYSLSFYDASWAATAAALRVPLISADRRLLAADLAESAASFSSRLQLDR